MFFPSHALQDPPTIAFFNAELFNRRLPCSGKLVKCTGIFLFFENNNGVPLIFIKFINPFLHLQHETKLLVSFYYTVDSRYCGYRQGEDLVSVIAREREKKKCFLFKLMK